MTDFEKAVQPYEGDPAQDALPHVPVTDPSTIPPDAVAIQRPEGMPPALHDASDHELMAMLGDLKAGRPLLDAKQRKSALGIIAQGAALMIAHTASMGYTEGSARWEGMTQKLRVVRNQTPAESDCSSSSTWLMFNAISHALGKLTGIPDVLNGENWAAGFTGSLAQNGVRVHGDSQLGDLCLYGPGPSFSHVTVALGGGYCVSHGSPGARKLPTDYRSDLAEFRRYF